MHVDPSSTDAFNALFRGHKWWVYLPSDVYEFDDELSCDESCSVDDRYAVVSNPKNYHETVQNDLIRRRAKHELWFAHILPQIR